MKKYAETGLPHLATVGLIKEPVDRWLSVSRSNQTRLQPPQEVLPICLRPSQRLRVIPILQFDFLQKQLDSILRLEPLRDQLPDAPRKAVLFLHHVKPRQMVRALVLTELRRRQPVIRCARVGLTQQRRQGRIPLALRARPSLKCTIGSPD